MKYLILIGFLIVFAACSHNDNEGKTDVLDEHGMVILPEVPTSKDEIVLVILNDCTYNKLTDVTRSRQTIEITKQFNGMMKWPCVMKNDTILIGKLPEGKYVISYKLLDIAPQTIASTVLSLSFGLTVKN